jgi:hypothetical protein
MIDKKDSELMLAIGNKLKQLRNNKPKTEICLSTDIHRNTMALMENGSNFEMKSLLKILRYHQISIFDFFRMLEDDIGDDGVVGDPAKIK